jgi:hypothetical protein
VSDYYHIRYFPIVLQRTYCEPRTNRVRCSASQSQEAGRPRCRSPESRP